MALLAKEYHAAIHCMDSMVPCYRTLYCSQMMRVDALSLIALQCTSEASGVSVVHQQSNLT